MTALDFYSLFLCVVIFAAFTVLFTFLFIMLLKSHIKLVRLGAEDEKIKTEYEIAKAKSSARRSKAVGCLCWALVIAVTAVALVSFITSVVIGAKEKSPVGKIPALKVVMSDSMATKNPDNYYLFDRGLDDQIFTFDLILLHKLPAEDQLEKYDVVAYERNGELILHRIIEIEEPTDKHPEKRYFLLRGDAVDVNDKFPVLYEDMRGIYEGERFPLLGSFFVFMKSPAGILCIILILFSVIATPIAERKVKEAKQERINIMFPSEPEPVEESDEELEEHLLHTDLFKFRSSRKQDILDFRLRVLNSSHDIKYAYVHITEYLESVNNIKISYSSTYQTFKLDGEIVARLAIRNNALNVYLANDPKEYAHIRGNFTDLSDQNSFKSYPMLIKANTTEKIDLICELIDANISENFPLN